MKTLHPVDEETYARIGKAYLICSQYPEVFEGIEYKKFCAMFVDDILDEEIDKHEARINAAAQDMYRILKAVNNWCQTRGDIDEDIECDIWEVLKAIDGEEDKS